jgi:hypothetical protein
MVFDGIEQISVKKILKIRVRTGAARLHRHRPSQVNHARAHCQCYHALSLAARHARIVSVNTTQSSQRFGYAAAPLATIFGLSAALALALPSTAAAAAQRLLTAPAPAASFAQRSPARRTFVRLAQQLVQDDDDGAEDSSADKGVPPAQIEKYVAVYRAMQRNHNLTIEQAAASQGLTVQAFRDLESRIESDDLARDDARNALAAPANDAAPQEAPASQR